MLAAPRNKALWSLKVGEQVELFLYLGTKVNIWNDISEEIKTGIMAANRSCFGLQKHLNSWSLSRTTKIQICQTIIKPIIMYRSECWTFAQTEEQKLGMFERKVLRRIYGPIVYRTVVSDDADITMSYMHDIKNKT
jgi:hypothetical protein